MREVRIGLIGFKSVGREFVRQLLVRECIVAERFGVRFSIVSIASFEGVLHGTPTICRGLLKKALSVSGGAVSSLNGGVWGESACSAVERVKSVTLSEGDVMAQAKGVQNCVKISTLDKFEMLLRGQALGVELRPNAFK